MSSLVLRAARLRAALVHIHAGSSATGLRFASSSSPQQQNPALIESTEEFVFVERLIPPSRIPDPPKHAGPAPSGWTPPAETPPPLPYMIRRSRMHNIPVYTDLTHGNRKMTLVRKVEGDIWLWAMMGRGGGSTQTLE
uniref:Large ribosomal subunit protein mL49 n=1 Tax=Oryzias sinensis TaxID=183150 RepID=A0A8C7YNZ3_9TELE